MARADLILSLVRAAAGSDQTLLRSTVEALAADERSKRHDVLAERLLKALNANAAPTSTAFAAPSPTVNAGRDFILESEPRRTLGDLTLDDHVRAQVVELIEEHHRADLLRSYGMQPRHRVLLAGPPGNGKTSLAEAIAEALAVPFFVVRYDALIGSYLGETNQRLKKLFDYVRTTPCVILFDEFDALGKERGDVHETGEIKRVVSSLLLQIDALPTYVVLIAATNHEELLDRAAWRRFELRLALERPTPQKLVDFARSALQRDGKLTAESLLVIERLELSSFAEAGDFIREVRRRFILARETISLNDAIRERARLWASRMRVPVDGERSDEAVADVRSAENRRTQEGGSSVRSSSRGSKSSRPREPHRPKVQ